MSDPKPYFMSGATFAEMERPYQVQTFVVKAEPPVCQEFSTYEDGAARICELMKSPMCPITGKHLKAIRLVKKTEPVNLIDMDIDAEDVLLKSGIGVQDVISRQGVPPWVYNRSCKDKEFRDWLMEKGITATQLIEAGFDFNDDPKGKE